MLYDALGLLQPDGGLHGGVPQPASAASWYVVRLRTYTLGCLAFDGLPPFFTPSIFEYSAALHKSTDSHRLPTRSKTFGKCGSQKEYWY